MIILTATKSLEIVLGGSVTTNQLPFVVSYVDTSAAQPLLETDGLTNNAVVVTMVTAPVSGAKVIKNITIYNKDTVSATVTVQYNNNGTVRILQKVALTTGYALVFRDDGGWEVHDTTGAPVQASPPSGAAGGDLTGTYPNPTIAASAVTLAKIANAAASSKLVGSGSSGSGAAYSEITLGTGLSMSSTTLNASAGVTAAPRNPEGRLTLTTATPVTSTDVATATSIFYTPYVGNIVWTYDSSVWTEHVFTERTLALGTLTSGKNYDVFIYNNSGTMTLEFSAAWTNDTTRADALAYQDGVLVKSSDHSRRYLGTFRTISTTQTTDTQAQRFCWNMYNRVSRSLVRMETTDTWVYNTATWRQANGSTANQVEIVAGQADDAVSIQICATMTQTSSANTVGWGIGEDSTTVTTQTNGTGIKVSAATNFTVSGVVIFTKIPVLGWHKYCWLEWANTTATSTFNGDNGGTELQSGMTGIWRA